MMTALCRDSGQFTFAVYKPNLNCLTVQSSPAVFRESVAIFSTFSSHSREVCHAMDQDLSV